MLTKYYLTTLDVALALLLTKLTLHLYSLVGLSKLLELKLFLSTTLTQFFLLLYNQLCKSKTQALLFGLIGVKMVVT
ncbi:MAG: hypothetical protein EBR34_15960 [Sphingomonadaceae bacterium]|nr:hypothetical protein [Sphingomonadaceae bacterium]